MNFIDFYRHQYAYCPSHHEPLFVTNKLTTPKENIKKLKVHRKDRDELTKFDFPMSMLAPNPLGIHYFELFGMSIGMYTKLKEEFKTIEFIKKYLSSSMIIKQNEDKDYPSNHDIMDSNWVDVLEEQEGAKKKKSKKEEEMRLEKKYVPLSEVFLKDNNFEIILHSLTCSSANREYNYEILEFLGDAVIALLLRFERVLCNRKYNEEKLDCDRIEKESNMEFYKINTRFGFCKYMIGTLDVSLKTFVPPLFKIIDFENILALRKNEMNNKLLFFKSMRYSYQREVEEITDNLFKQNP